MIFITKLELLLKKIWIFTDFNIKTDFYHLNHNNLLLRIDPLNKCFHPPATLIRLAQCKIHSRSEILQKGELIIIPYLQRRWKKNDLRIRSLVFIFLISSYNCYHNFNFKAKWNNIFNETKSNWKFHLSWVSIVKSKHPKKS